MKNIEIRIDLHRYKKVLRTGLACMMTFVVMPIDHTTVRAATDSMLTQTVSTDTQSYTYYREAKSDPKKISFTQSTIKVEKYGKVYIPSVMNITPKIANTIPNTEGIKYWTGNSKIASVTVIDGAVKTDVVLTAKKEGRTWLYVETPNKVRAKVSVLVTPQEDYSCVSFVENVVKSGLKQSFNVNDYVIPSYMVTGGDATRIIKPNRKYTYRIGNSKIAKVAANGIVQGLAKGRTWLYVKSESGFENRISINIVDAQKKATSITMPKTQTVNMKEKVKLKVTTLPANSKIASWRIGNSKVATINQSGIVTGVSVGNTYAYAKLANGKEVRSLIKVINPDKLRVRSYSTYDVLQDGDAVDVTSLKFSFDVDRIIKNDIRKSNGYPILKAKTGNSKVAVVSEIKSATLNHSQVIVKAVGNGNTWLHLETADGLQYKILLKVKKPTLKEFSMPSKITISKDDLQYLTSSLKIDNYYKGGVKYRTGNSGIARVDEFGNLIGISEGLTYLYTECNGKTLKTLVSVKSNPTVKSIKLDKSVVDINVKKDNYGKINASINPTNTVNPKITFKVGNKNIADVYQNGTIIGRSNGSTYVYATAENGVTTKTLVKVTGFDEINQINTISSIDIDLNKSTPGNSDRITSGITTSATFNTDYGNNSNDIEVYVGNNSIAKITSINRSSYQIVVTLVAKAPGNTYIYYKIPNGKATKTLIKVHW